METITLGEIQKLKPKGLNRYKNNEVFLDFIDGSERQLICDCGHNKFVKEGALFRCLECNTMKILPIKFS